MTTRELTTTRAVLDFLHSLDGGQATELEIHKCVWTNWLPGEPKPSAAEIASIIANCDAQQWITGVPARFKGGMKWNLNDAGEAARLEMA